MDFMKKKNLDSWVEKRKNISGQKKKKVVYEEHRKERES